VVEQDHLVEPRPLDLRFDLGARLDDRVGHAGAPTPIPDRRRSIGRRSRPSQRSSPLGALGRGTGNFGLNGGSRSCARILGNTPIPDVAATGPNMTKQRRAAPLPAAFAVAAMLAAPMVHAAEIKIISAN